MKKQNPGEATFSMESTGASLRLCCDEERACLQNALGRTSSRALLCLYGML